MDDLEFDYSHYKEPLREVKDGYGYMGTMRFTKDGEGVECHICGQTFANLLAHVSASHKIRAKDYKAKFGLSPKIGLISPKMRIKLQDSYKKMKDPSMIKRLFKSNTKESRKKMSRQPKLSLQIDNKRGTCPDQTRDRIIKLAKKLGYAPSPKEYRAEYNGRGGYEAVIRHFGSWSEAMYRCGLKPKSEIQKDRFSKERLLDSLRAYYEKHGRTPRSSDFRNSDDLPGRSVFRDRFGTLNKARKLAGIPQLKQVGRGNFVEFREK